MASAKSTVENSTKENTIITCKPSIILLFSGKRKSGKDYITDKLYERIGPDKSVIIKISGPIKSHWAKLFNLDINKLLSDGEYKEKYRADMIKWGEEMRKEDSGYFCRAAITMYNAEEKLVWIVSDIRRKTDIRWFTENFGEVCKTIRISSSEEIRKQRGWVFTPGVDDAESECDLDDITEWDLDIVNNTQNIESVLQEILKLIQKNN